MWLRVWGFGLMLLACSCGVREYNQEMLRQEAEMLEQAKVTAQPIEPVKPIDTTSVFGSYFGPFEAEKYHEDRSVTFTNRITIFIDSMQGDRLYGHSVVAGNNTPFDGTFKTNGKGIYAAEAREPGTSKEDGRFLFELDSVTKVLKGRWIAFDTSLTVTERSFELTKRYFKYDPHAILPDEFAQVPVAGFTEENDEGEGGKAESTTEDVLKFNPSTTLLETKDVENMKRGDLEVMRNAIYARHGYTFRNRNMRVLFDNVDWYMPVSTDIRADLSEIEQQNIALLKRYEEHAARYYDYFGR